MYSFLIQDCNTVGFFSIEHFMCGYKNTFNHHQSSCSLLTTYWQYYGKGLNKKQGVNEERATLL